MKTWRRLYGGAMKEELLPGGNSSLVVRIGDTVHRTAGSGAPAVHRLLGTIREHGITEVPEPRGFDAAGREVLSYLPGEVGNYPLPGWMWEDTVLDEAGALLRRIHDASVSLVAENLEWGWPSREPAEVICHNDVAPYNMTFIDGHVAGLFDFDTAAPGPRIWDLAYLAYRLVPFTADLDPADLPEGNRLDRLDRLMRAYGEAYSRAAVLQTMVERLDDIALYTDRRASETGRFDFLEHAAMYRRDRQRIAGIPV